MLDLFLKLEKLLNEIKAAFATGKDIWDILHGMFFTPMSVQALSLPGGGKLKDLLLELLPILLAKFFGK